MRFFLVGTDSDSDGIRLIAERTFESRRDALEHLSSVAPGLGDEVFVVDLDAASPVLLLPAPVDGRARPPAETADEPTPDEFSAEAPPVAEAAADATPSLGEDEDDFVGVIDIDDDLAVAVAHATAEVDLAAVIPEPPDPEMPRTLTEEPRAIASEPEPEPPTGLSAEYPTPYVPEVAAWPWDAARDTDEAPTDAAPDDGEEKQPEQNAGELVAQAADEPPAPELPAAIHALDPLEEPAVDDEGLVQAPHDVVPASRAVVMGEYSDEQTADASEDVRFVGVPVEPMGARDPEPEEETPPALLVDATEPPAMPADEPPAQEPPAEAAPVLSAVPDISTAAAPDDEPDIVDYTCDDCVYVNTCPKHHESEPTSCGSFQWRIA